MSRRLAIGIAFLLAWAFVWGCWPKISNEKVVTGAIATSRRTWSYPSTLDSVIPPNVQKVIARSDRVEAFLVARGMVFVDPKAKDPAYRARYGNLAVVADSTTVPLWLGRTGYRNRSETRDLSKSQADRARSLFLNVHSYQRFAKPCIFEPTVAYIFHAGQDSAKAAVCLGCFELVLVSNLGRSGGELDPMGIDLTRLSLEVFPEDSTLAQLLKRHLAHPPRP